MCSCAMVYFIDGLTSARSFKDGVLVGILTRCRVPHLMQAFHSAISIGRMSSALSASRLKPHFQVSSLTARPTPPSAIRAVHSPSALYEDPRAVSF